MLKMMKYGMLSLALSFCSISARAGYTVHVTESGGNVIAQGSGTLDVKDLTLVSGGQFPPTFNPSLDPQTGEMIFGSTDTGYKYDRRQGSIAGPSGFGPGGLHTADQGSGDYTGLLGGDLIVPYAYQSGSSLFASASWQGATFSSLGLTPGTYTWTWGTGEHADFLTLKIGDGTVPEPASLLMMGMGLVGVASFARRRCPRTSA